MNPRPLHYNFAGCRLGDKCVAAWMLGTKALAEGRPVSWRDPTEQDADSFSVREFFPLLDEMEVAQDESPDCMDTGNLWINARPLWQAQGGIGAVRMCPPAILPECPLVIHVLADAPYNTARNWTWEQGARLASTIAKELDVMPWLVPPIGTPGRLPSSAVLMKIAAARVFIGGDSGFSHAFGLMNPDRPLVWIGHDMAGDKAAFGPGFDSSPMSANVTRFHLTQNIFDLDAVLAHVAKVLPTI